MSWTKVVKTDLGTLVKPFVGKLKRFLTLSWLWKKISLGQKVPTFLQFKLSRRITYDRRAYPHFKDCMGSFNGTHIHVSLPPDEQVWYIGKSMIATQNILTVYDLNMWFTCVHGAARSYA